jgi:hypothetical protein
MLVYLSANALVLAVVIATKRVQQDGQGRNRIAQTLHMLALTYFWFFFALIDYARIGRSRLSDPYFMIAFAVLVAALVLRLTDPWMTRRRLAEKVG